MSKCGSACPILWHRNHKINRSMPISPLYEWKESESALEVQVQLQGASKLKPDVFATDCMLKVNSPPYLLILDLFGFVDESQSVVTITAEGVLFRLKKQGAGGTWGQLEPCADKEEILARRNASVDRAHARIEEARKLRLQRKVKEEKEAVDRQIELERKRRQEIESRKKKELEDERTKLDNWQKGMDGSKPTAGGGDANAESDYESEAEEDAASDDRPMSDHPDYHGKGWKGEAPEKASKSKQQQQQLASTASSGVIVNDDDEDDDEATHVREWERHEDIERQLEVPAGQSSTALTFRPLPPPRTRLQPVHVEFTKLETGHLPAREQREEEIRVYKKSIGQQGPGADSADIADRQPAFLKDKGDAFYKQGNFRGAVNAYSRALELDPDQANPAVWSNRAACFMQLGEHESCAADCSRALQILQARLPRVESAATPSEVDGLRRQLVKSLVRRAQARASLGLLAGAEEDYVEALRFDPDNPALRSDLDEVRAAMEPADASSLKQRGTARFQAKDYEGAVQAFTLLLGMPAASVPESERLAALGNRSVCLLVMEKYNEAVQDCTAALDIHLACIRGRPERVVEAAGPCLPEPPARSSPEQLHQWVEGLSEWPLEAAQAAAASKVAARRGAALAHLRKFAASALDYGSAAALAGLAGDAVLQAQLAEDTARLQAMVLSDGSSCRPGEGS